MVLNPSVQELSVFIIKLDREFLTLLDIKLKGDSNTPKCVLFEFCMQKSQGFKALLVVDFKVNMGA